MSIIIHLWILSVQIFSATTQSQALVAINIIPDTITLENDTDPISYAVSCQVGRNFTQVLNMTLTNEGNSVEITNSNVTDIQTTGYFDSGYVTSNLSAGYLKIEFIAVSPTIHFGSFHCAAVERYGTVIVRNENTVTLSHISKPLIEVNKTQLIEQSKLIVTCTTTAACIEVNSIIFYLNYNTTNNVTISSPSTCERLTITQSAVYNVNETFYYVFGRHVKFSCSVVYAMNISTPSWSTYTTIRSDTITEFVGSAFGEECRYNSSCATVSAFCDITLPKPICSCPAGLHYFQENDMCDIGIAFGEECRYNRSCATVSAFCDITLPKPICSCPAALHYFKENDMCDIVSAFGEECRYNSSCVTVSAFCDITLPKPICTCPAGLHYFKENDMCDIGSAFGEECGYNSSCATVSAFCDITLPKPICTCPPGLHYFKENYMCDIDGVAINIIQNKNTLENDTDPISYAVSCQVGRNFTQVLNMTLTNRGNTVVIIKSNVTDIKTTGYYDRGYVTSNLSAGYLKIEFVDVSPQKHFGSFTCAVVGRSGTVILRKENTATLRHISKPVVEVNITQLRERSKLIVTCTTTAACIEVNSMIFYPYTDYYTRSTAKISSSSSCKRLTTTQSAEYNVNDTFYCAFVRYGNVTFSCSAVYTSNITAPRRRRYVDISILHSDTITAFVGSAFGEECRYNSSCVTVSAFCDITLPKPICTCPAGLHYFQENDLCDIEPCPEDSDYMYLKSENACFTLKDSSTNDSWDDLCTEEYAVALPFTSRIRTQFIWILQNAFATRCNQTLGTLVISTNHSLDEMNKPQWFLPTGERLDINPEPENGWVSSPSSCLYMLFDGQNISYHVSSDCNLTEPHKGCFIQLSNKYCEQNVDELYQKTWNYTRGGIQVNQSCPNTHEGQVTRECQPNGVWKSLLYNCTLKSLAEILSKLSSDIINGTEAISNLIMELPLSGSNDTNTTFTISDLKTIQAILQRVTDIISNESIKAQTIEDFLQIASVVVDHETSGVEWRRQVQNEGKGAEEFLNVVDNFIAKAVQSLINNNQSSLNITKQNLVLLYVKVEPNAENPNSIVFPTGLENDPKWNTTETSSVFLNYTAFYDQGVTAYSVVLYRNLSQSVPSTLSERPNNNNVFVNSQVLSVQMFPKAPYPLNPNIEFTFRGFRNMDTAEKYCSFWKLNETSYLGTWSTEGCREIFSNSTHVKCACNHLTNFALLISPYVPPEKHVSILEKISIVGISISMAALLITIGIHALHWRLVKSDNSILLVSLCVVLLVGNALFLGGVTRTAFVVGCKVIAAFLHYLFLVAFFLMLAEGVKIFIKIVFIFNKTSYLVHMLAVSLVVPLVIVGISMGVTKLEGYGDTNFCWLSRKNGVFWAFAGPVCLVILINFIIIGYLIKTVCRERPPGVKESIFQKARLTAIKLMVIVPVLGVSWISGILSVNEDSLWLQYVFCIFNSLQGVAILIFHVIRNTKLHKAMQARRARKKSLEDFPSNSKSSNSGFKQKIKGFFGIKQSSSCSSNGQTNSAFAVSLTADDKSSTLNQKQNRAVFNEYTIIDIKDNNTIDSDEKDTDSRQKQSSTLNQKQNRTVFNEYTDIDYKDNTNIDSDVKDTECRQKQSIRTSSCSKTFPMEEQGSASHIRNATDETLIVNANDVEVETCTKLKKANQAKRVRDRSVEDFPPSPRHSNSHLRLKQKIKAIFGIKQSSSLAVETNSPFDLSITTNDQVSSLHQKKDIFNATTETDNTDDKTIDSYLKDEDNRQNQTIQNASEVETVHWEDQVNISPTERYNTELFFVKLKKNDAEKSFRRKEPDNFSPSTTNSNELLVANTKDVEVETYSWTIGIDEIKSTTINKVDTDDKEYKKTDTNLNDDNRQNKTIGNAFEAKTIRREEKETAFHTQSYTNGMMTDVENKFHREEPETVSPKRTYTDESITVITKDVEIVTNIEVSKIKEKKVVTGELKFEFF